MMRSVLPLFLCFAASTSPTKAYALQPNPSPKASSSSLGSQHVASSVSSSSDSATCSRRGWFGATAAAILTASSSTCMSNSAALAADSSSKDPLTPVYFGVGCFWHIQHEFIQAERDLLGRDDHQLTSRTGYAGGKTADKQGRVCYHNFEGIGDYGKLGHGEVVGMNIPESKIGDFGRVYFSLFNPKTKDRVDPGDRGGEYRSLIGLPGGVDHPKYADVQAAATAAGFTLRPGQGNDPDTLGKALAYVYDTKVFPFYQAEVYHQYHNDFQSPPYGRKYNSLAALALEEGRIQPTACPSGF